MNACFERFVRSMLVRGISRRARGDTSFFANRRTHAVVALDEFVINGTRRKKLAAFSLFSFTPPWPRRRLVVSWGSPPFGRTTKVPLIACTYLNSCLRLVRSELSLRVCVSCLCICVCVCVYVMRFFCFHSRTCSRTSEFSCREVPLTFILQVYHLFVIKRFYSHCHLRQKYDQDSSRLARVECSVSAHFFLSWWYTNITWSFKSAISLTDDFLILM